MRRILFLSLALMALLGFVAPPDVFAQAAAPQPKFTITGLIDMVTSYAENVNNYDGIWNRKDTQWYGRTRGRFDIIGEVGSAKGVFGFEIDSTWGQTGSADTALGGGTQAFGTTSAFDLNTDAVGNIETKWLYIEFPVPLIPVPMIARLGAQPFATAASYKLATYANGDFAGVNLYTTITPSFKLQWTYAAVEENLVGTETSTGLSGPLGIANTQNRGDDYALIVSPEFTPFKGLDIKPMFSMFYASGTTSGSARAARGGINTSTAYQGTGGASRGGIEEHRYTVGVDARYRMGPFSFDPSVLYQFGHRAVVTPAAFVDSGGATGQVRYADINAWLLDGRIGYQLGPLLLQGLGMYTTGNTARNNTLSSVQYYQPLSTDTGYLADWGTQLTSLGLDYLSAMGESGARVAYPGNHIGWDKYGRAQVGVKATYAITPALSAMLGVNGHWTAEEVDRNGTAIAGAGILPVFAGPTPRDRSRYIGTEFMSVVSWRFAPGLVWDNGFGYMLSGPALDAITDPAAGGQNAQDAAILTSRVRFSF